jgi:Flp pilus assembly protein TadG
MKRQLTIRLRGSQGQSLVETALMLPLLILLVFNAVNFGYFFLVITNLTAASRSSALYSIQGASTPSATVLPAPGPATNNALGQLTVAYIAQQDFGPLANASNACIQICSSALGITPNGSGSTLANCASYSGTGSTCSVGTAITPAADPESTFVLNEVYVTYRFNPLIPGKIFNIALLAMPSGMCTGGTCTWNRTARMRGMN